MRKSRVLSKARSRSNRSSRAGRLGTNRLLKSRRVAAKPARARRRVTRSRQTRRTDTVRRTGPLNPAMLRKMDAWWRAANFLSVGQTYLYDNPLLKEPLRKEHVKPRLIGH